ncbi:MAG: VTT domain-containing protein [Deltaproteobacteria bacterium]|nr:VTT domain-containing protein [Deltaproteobacteria bacterium]
MSDPQIDILPPDPDWQPPKGPPPVTYDVEPPPPGVVSDVYEAKPPPGMRHPDRPQVRAQRGDPAVFKKLLKLASRVAIVAVIGLLLVWALEPFGPDSLQHSVLWLRDQPVLGRILAVLLVAAGVPFLVPVGPMAMIPAYAWGTTEGVVLGLAGAVLGGTLNYWVSKRFIGPHLLAWLDGNEVIRSLYLTVDRRGARVLLGMRMSPVMPFGLLCYLSGLTSINWALFALVMAVGGLPWTTVYAVAGGMLGESHRAMDLGAAADGPYASLLRWIGLAVTIALATWIGRVARRDLLDMRAGRGTP